MTVRIAFVIQRYGDGLVGGAEAHGRLLAERLHRELGWTVDVYTTTARDYRTWAKEYSAGDSSLGGVTVRRFHSRRGRSRLFPVINRLLVNPLVTPLRRVLGRLPLLRPLLLRLEWLWILLQGPYCPDLVDEVCRRAGDYRRVLLMTYLYYPTQAVARRLGRRTILIPTAHDEPAFWFESVRDLLAEVGAVAVNTEPEADLVREQLGPGRAVPLVIAGVGLEAPSLGPPPEGRPYIFYLGRISAGKGVDRLLSWFLSYCERPGAPKDLTLKLAGHLEADLTLPAGPRVEYLGYVTEEAKGALIRGAKAVINPSPRESLSLVALEAMAAQVPVLVNRECDVFRHYAEQTATVFPFAGANELAAALATVLGTDWQRDAEQRQLAATRAWVLERFGWARVLKVFEGLIV